MLDLNKNKTEEGDSLDNASEVTDDPSKVTDLDKVGAEVFPADESEKASKKTKLKRGTSSSDYLKQFDTPQGRSAATILLSVLAAFLMIFFAVRPAVSSITKQTEINSSLRERNLMMEGKLNSILEVARKEDQAVLNGDKPTFDNVMSIERHQDLIYTELTDLVRANLSLPLTVRYQSIRLSTVGSIEGIHRLIDQIETGQRIYDIRDIAYSVPESDDVTPNDIQVEITMTTLYWEDTGI